MILRLLSVAVLLSVARPAPAAGPMYWDWPTERSFAELELAGAALDENGNLVAGLAARVLGPAGPEVCWTAVADGRGGYYAATGHGGEVHRVDADGESELLVRLEGTEVFSLLLLPGGDLLAGCGPEGHLYRVRPDGSQRRVGTVEGGYVWGLSRSPVDGRVWVAGGSPGSLYRYDPRDDEFSLAVTLEAQNALDVRALADGGVLIATQGPGLVFRYEPGGELTLLCETAQDEARQFITGPEGDLFLLALRNADDGGDLGGGKAGSLAAAPPPALLALLGGEPVSETPAAALYRISADGRVAPYWTGPGELLTAAWSPRWGWLAGGPLPDEDSQASLQRLTPPSGARTVARWAGGDVLQILVADDGDRLIVCQAHQGSLVAVSAEGPAPREAVSPPLDGSSPVKWGRLNWQGEVPQGKLKWAVRGGNRSVPDDTWTPWSRAWSGTDQAIELPPCRFLQWRVVWPDGAAAESARVTAVAVSAWQDNQAPVLAAFQLEHLQEIHLGGMLNGSENVTQRFRSGLQAEFSRNTSGDPWAGPVRGGLGRSVRIFTWQGSDPNGDRLAYRLDYRRLGDAAWRPVPTGRPGVFETGETLLSWDTAEVPDGSYEMRLTASDRRDNPADLALTATSLLRPVLVDNTPPELADFTVRATEGGFVVRCRAEDRASTLAGARLFLPDGSVERLDPTDRICDSLREEFKAEVAWPRAGVEAGVAPWRVRLEVRDLAGNLGVVEGEVR